jgi:hypothetical protein
LRHFQLLIVVSKHLRWRAKIHARSWRAQYSPPTPPNVTKSRAAHALQEVLHSTSENGYESLVENNSSVLRLYHKLTRRIFRK